MHSSFFQKIEHDEDSNYNVSSIDIKITYSWVLGIIILLLQFASIIAMKLSEIAIDYRNPFFISSLLFCLFAFLNVVYVIIYFFYWRFINSNSYAFLYMQYHYEIEKLQPEKISTDIAERVSKSFENDKNRKYISKYCEPLSLLKKLSLEKWNNGSIVTTSKNVSGLLYGFGTTTIGIIISLLLANNLSKEVLLFNVLLFACMLIVFFAFVIVPNPAITNRICKKLATKTELIMRLNEEIEIQERKIFNKE